MAKRSEYDQSEGMGLFVIGAALGSLIGAAAALWLAPKSGRETRHDIESGVTDLLEGAETVAADTRRVFETNLKELRQDMEQTAIDARRRIEGETLDDALQAGKAEARKFQGNRVKP